MRRAVAAWCCAMAMGLQSCGGSGGSAPAPQLRINAAQDDASRTPSGVVHTHRIEVRNTGDAAAHAVVISVSPDAQALQLPLSCESAGCVSRSDGGIEITEIAAGGAVVIRQPLRIKPGHRGAVRNEWQASAAGSSAAWRQELTAYVTDVSVTVFKPVGLEPTRTYEVTLVNHGPDEAADVRWTLFTVPGQLWRVDACTASAGANCPATLGEAMQLAKLPAGGSVRLQVLITEATSTADDGLASRADAAGDPTPGNNESGQGRGSHYFLTDLEGRHYRMSLGFGTGLRVTGAEVNYQAPYFVDVTGAGFLGESDSVDPPWSRGLLSFFGPIRVFGLDIGGVRKPYVAPSQLIAALGELEGISFTVLGSRSDATGKPLDAYTGSARFKDGTLQLCLPDAPTPFDQCPVQRLTRFDASLVGSEVELVSRDRVLRLRAARSSDGPILISSARDADGSEFWMGLPVVPNPRFISDALKETTFESASGHSTAALALVDKDQGSHGNARITPSLSVLPNVFLLHAHHTGLLGICGIEAELSPTGQPGLFQGELHGDWLPGEFVDGQFKKERACFAGSVHHAQTDSFAVVLGAKGGGLMGRWMLAGPGYR